MKPILYPVLILLLLCSDPVHVFAADAGNGSRVYASNCEICHADNGQGIVPDAPDFRFGDQLIKPDFELFNAISAGVGMMPAYRGLLSEKDIMDVISYLRTLQQ